MGGWVEARNTLDNGPIPTASRQESASCAATWWTP